MYEYDRGGARITCHKDDAPKVKETLIHDARAHILAGLMDDWRPNRWYAIRFREYAEPDLYDPKVDVYNVTVDVQAVTENYRVPIMPQKTSLFGRAKRFLRNMLGGA